MGKRRSRAGRLRLHRETVRTLADRDLTGVGGGTIVILANVNIGAKDDGGDKLPRSNAWTGDGALWGCND